MSHWIGLIGACTLLGLAQMQVAAAQTATKANNKQQTATHDGQHDFDFEIGTWKTHLRRRLHPLSGTNEWVAYDGTSVVRKVWGGRANGCERGFATANA